MALSKAFVWGDGGAALTPEELAQARLMEARALAKGIDTSPVGHWSQGAARVADAIAGAFRRGALDKAGEANAAYDADLLSSISGAAFPSSVAEGGSTFAPAATGVDSVPSGAAEIKAKLVERGLPEHVADGFVVNFADESGLNPGINEQNPTVPGSRGGYGLYQLTGPRRVAYEQFAKSKGVPYSDVDTQLDFLVSELKGPEAAAAEKIFAAPDSGTAAAAIAANFLRPNAKSLSERVAKYTAGVPNIPLGGAPVQVASLEPGAGIGIPTGDTNPNRVTPIPVDPRFAEAATIPQTQPAGADMPAGQPGEIRQGPNGQTYQYVETTNMAGATGSQGWIPVNTSVQPGQPMTQPPAQDVTQVPALSSGAGLSFQAPQVGAYATPAVAAVINQPALSPAVQQVSAALPIRAQADPNDIMVAGRDQTAQPQIPTGVPSAVPSGQPSPQALIRAMTDPRASPRTRQVAEVLYKQQAQQAQAQYEAQLQANDPKRQLEIRKLQQEVEGGKKQPLVNVGNGVLYDPNNSQWLTAPGQEDKIPESVRALEIRADRAGLVKGTPEYNQFMLSGGQKGTSLSIGPDGTVQFSEGVGVSGKPLTENQSKLTLFQSLQTETQPVLLDLEGQFNPANLPDAAARSAPIAGNFFKSEQGQIYDAAATAWAEGALRIATGAAATPEEMERTKRAYFAQPGDTPNTIAFKAQMREMYNRSIDRSLGKKSEGVLPKPSDFAKTVKSTIGDDDDDGLTRPENVPESDWKYMTPEEQRLFVK